MKFFVTGLDSGFSFADMSLLWNVAQICELDEPSSLYFSIQSLSKCMSQITNQAAADNNLETPKYQNLLSKLFAYRTKIQNESDDKKGLSSTDTLESGQRLRIILPGKGVFASQIVNNGKMIVISIPKQKDMIVVGAEDWVGKVISVYFWRKGDAQYVFDTLVAQHGIYLGKSALFLKQSYNLTRTQKRKSVRAKCEIYAELFFVKKSESGGSDINFIESKNGYRCLLEDISESGALIKIGGRGRENIKIKLQFTIKNRLIVMTGIVRKVDYNESLNQSHLHFECMQIEEAMKNEILAYVYNMLPEGEKEVLEAIKQTEFDSEEESGENGDESSFVLSNEKSGEILENTGGVNISEENAGEKNVGEKNVGEENDSGLSLGAENEVVQEESVTFHENETKDVFAEEPVGENVFEEDSIEFKYS